LTILKIHKNANLDFFDSLVGMSKLSPNKIQH